MDKYVSFAVKTVKDWLSFQNPTTINMPIMFPVDGPTTSRKIIFSSALTIDNDEVKPTAFGEKVFYLLRNEGITVTWTEVGHKLRPGSDGKVGKSEDVLLLLRLSEHMPPHLRDEIKSYSETAAAKPLRFRDRIGRIHSSCSIMFART